ncbi:MAG: thiamine-phosphate kinase [Chitinivibrionales bacterium]|nr:thiamine-phosphate kinase [Chitinivibrionales bacterium]
MLSQPRKRNRYPSLEYGLLERLKPYLNFKPSKAYPFGIGDDAAVRQNREKEKIILTTDTLVEDTHFSLEYMTLRETGYKAMVSNISDCAAMGAMPESALVTVVFPAKHAHVLENRIKKIYEGLYDACLQWDTRIIGGDTIAGPCWIISITLIGRALGRVLKRGQAKPGDSLWVTGMPGESAAGLAAIRKWGRKRAMPRFQTLIDRHVRPQPRVEYGAWLAGNRYVHACIDVSDGISKECATMAYDSGCGIILELDSLPFSHEMIQLGDACKTSPREWFLHGGEDYELLWSAAPRFVPAFDLCNATRIGTVTDKASGVSVRQPEGGAVRIVSKGWDHLEKNGESENTLQT